MIEWAGKGLQVVPQNNLLISIHYVPVSQTGRSIHLKPQGQRYNELIEQLKKESEFWSKMRSAKQGRI